jgi:hypothetical protein
MLTPLSAGAASAAPANASGSASSSALQVTVAPSALLSIANQLNPAVGQALQTVDGLLGGALSGSDLKLTLDAANAKGLLSSSGLDILGGHSDSTALAVDFAPLNKLLGQLKVVLDTLTTVDSTVFHALPQAIQDQLTALHLNLDQPLEKILQQLGINVNSTIAADLNQAGVADHPISKNGLINVPAPVQLNIAPYHAFAVNRLLSVNDPLVAGSPQVSADNSTTALNIVPALANLSGLNLGGLLTQLTNLDLTGVLNTLLGANSPVLGTVNSVLAGTPAGSLGLTGQLGAITSALSGPVSTVQTTLQNSPVAGAVTQIKSLLDGLGILNSLTGANAGALGLNGLIQTAGVTSTALFHPTTGNGVEAVATTKLVDLQVLPLAAGLLNTLGLSGGTSLLHIEGIAANAASAFGDNAGSPSASSSLAKISVLGHTIVDTNNIAALAQGQQLTLGVPGLPLSVVVTRGAPQVSYDTAAERDVSISALEVSVVTTASSALTPFSRHAVTSGTKLVDVSIGNAMTRLSMSPVSAPAVSNPTAPVTAQPSLPKTGMFGPLAIVIGGLLGLVAISLRTIPGLRTRFRGVR